MNFRRARRSRTRFPTKQQFAEWLETGQGSYRKGDTLALFLASKLGEWPERPKANDGFWRDSSGQLHRLPEWAKAFVTAVHLTPGLYISTSTALEILNGISTQ